MFRYSRYSFFNHEGTSLINISHLPLSFFLSLSFSPFPTCARTCIRSEARNWLIPARSAFNFDFESVLSQDGAGTRVPGTRNTTSDRDSISRISIGRSFRSAIFRVLRARSITDCTDRTCVTRTNKCVMFTYRKYCPAVNVTNEATSVTRLNLIRIMLVVNVRPPLEHRLWSYTYFFISIRYDDMYEK